MDPYFNDFENTFMAFIDLINKELIILIIREIIGLIKMVFIEKQFDSKEWIKVE